MADFQELLHQLPTYQDEDQGGTPERQGQQTIDPYPSRFKTLGLLLLCTSVGVMIYGPHSTTDLSETPPSETLPGAEEAP